MKKYSDVIDQHLTEKDYVAASDAIDRLAEFYLGCMPVCEDEKWK